MHWHKLRRRTVWDGFAALDILANFMDCSRIERRFCSLKTEDTYVNESTTPKELRSAIRQYVGTYNTKRPHEALEYAAPSEAFSAA